MKIKICGLSDPDSIRQIALLRPSMMGFIFYAPSPRNACALLPSVVNALPADISRTYFTPPRVTASTPSSSMAKRHPTHVANSAGQDFVS